MLFNKEARFSRHSDNAYFCSASLLESAISDTLFAPEDEQFSAREALSFGVKHVWMFVPVLLYLILFFGHGKLFWQWGGSKYYEPNFIVAIDSFFFRKSFYEFLTVKIQSKFLDVVAGLPYLLHFTIPFLYLVHLLKWRKPADYKTLFKYVFSFGLANASAIVVQYQVPTPPPWMLRGMSPEANFYRIDEMTGLGIFKRLYAASSLLSGSFPSLHTAWPAIVLFVSPWTNTALCVCHVTLIAFAAVYSMHHYALDIVFGLMFAWISCRIGSRTVERHIAKWQQRRRTAVAVSSRIPVAFAPIKSAFPTAAIGAASKGDLLSAKKSASVFYMPIASPFILGSEVAAVS